MKKFNFDHNWEFTFDNSLDAFNIFGFDKYADASGAPARFYDYSNWERIDLPHDWAVSLPKNLAANTFAGARANTHFHRYMTERWSPVEKIYNVGWYRKQFAFDPAWEGKRVFLEFEGVFRDAIVWINGSYMDRHCSGYTGFILDITDHLLPGEDNSVAVRVDSDQPEGWWYEGAGIYRHVNLLVGEPVYFQYNQTVVKTALDGSVYASAVLVNDTDAPATLSLQWEIRDDKTVVATASENVTVPAYNRHQVWAQMQVEDPQYWTVESPNLYTLSIHAGAEETSQRFGIRTVSFDAERGFLLNGKEYKIRGACVHQDFGGVGIALSDNLNRYKIKKLKEMGVNAYRCAHHAPTPALLDACDELGMLVMDETRMFGTSPEAVRQLTDLIERDRNHPSVFIWALGNEEFRVQHLPISGRLIKKMTRLAKALDDTRPVTYGSNIGEWFVGAGGASEVRGINYIRNGTGDGTWLETYHREHPEQPVIGTEETSYVISRGGVKTDLGNGLLSSAGDVTMPWGTTPKGFVKRFEETPWLAGSFMWTGFDYRGEPNPFITTNVSSSFGTLDLTGMEKPPFWYYKAWWTDEPVLKLTPHWNHEVGETVTMYVFTNCEEITLYINGCAVETKRVAQFDAPAFTVEFQPGEIAVEGRRNGKIYRDTICTAGKTTEVRCATELLAHANEDVGIYQLEAYDADGNINHVASDLLNLSVENGKIIGVGNGDPACLDDEQNPLEEEAIFLRTFHYDHGMYSVPMKTPNMHRRRYDYIENEPKVNGYEDDFRTVAQNSDNRLPKETLTLTTRFLNDKGYEYVEFERLGGVAKVYLNGKLIGDNLRGRGRVSCCNIRPYRFYCDILEGENELTVVTEQQESSGLPFSGYVKVGKLVEKPYKVRLHYGKARVFVKSGTPDKVKLTAMLSLD
ncbi:MAG: DUF4982 domain-containing protein [Oscillospiraceae bacterium]|nr:DUF4982 domain-containing protein [Oscillospiraceae bacterium]